MPHAGEDLQRSTTPASCSVQSQPQQVDVGLVSWLLSTSKDVDLQPPRAAIVCHDNLDMKGIDI